MDITKNSLIRVAEAVDLTSNSISEAVAKDLLRRKLILSQTITYFEISPTEDFSCEIEKLQTDLTQSMINSGSWKTSKFKTYNFNAAGILPRYGSTHPLIETMNVFRNVLIQMGFEEMPTRRWVESSFWNFDSLFQPQTHPVRDAHDTFFMREPSSHDVPTKLTESPDLDYFTRVKNIHERGDEDSRGYQSKWCEKEACKLVMRTHTTANSSQMLRQIAKSFIKVREIARQIPILDRSRAKQNSENVNCSQLIEFSEMKL